MTKQNPDRSIVALHGFMGLPSDWQAFSFEGDIVCPNLNHLDPHKGLLGWAKEINGIAEMMSRRPILMGYSFGGRLALHALIERPELWKGAIIISSHPGLNSEEMRSQRIAEDREWAKKVLTNPWDEFISDWNGRAVFSKTGFGFQRKESDFDRRQLSEMLISGSLGCQRDLQGLIAKLPMPILWMVGEKDSKYRQIAKGMNFNHPRSEVCEVEGAGHRHPWEKPEYFMRRTREFIEFCECS